ncbi:hypothetical protein EV361DRAFT_917858 [Lentinula raphanica]|nr:hypothetical protein EV361DRAFT_917858 [Lentinula raphanica]
MLYLHHCSLVSSILCSLVPVRPYRVPRNPSGCFKVLMRNLGLRIERLFHLSSRLLAQAPAIVKEGSSYPQTTVPVCSLLNTSLSTEPFQGP